MKTKELIAQLLEADPTGEGEVCVWNHDIHYVERKPAYWDGRLERLDRDPTKQCYNIIKGRIVSKGDKIQIRPITLEDAIGNDPDLPVEINAGNADSDARYAAQIEAWRQEMRDAIAAIEGKS